MNDASNGKLGVRPLFADFVRDYSMRILASAVVVALVCLTGLAGALAADAPMTPVDKPELVLTATVPGAVKAGDKVTVTVEIKNTTDTAQTIDVPSMWWAKSDNPAVTFPKWPRMGGIGPVIRFKQETIEAGKSYTHTWEATIGADTAAGELAFKIGIPLKRNGGNVWSDAVKLTVKAK
jgi:hypothetical protein